MSLSSCCLVRKSLEYTHTEIRESQTDSQSKIPLGAMKSNQACNLKISTRGIFTFPSVCCFIPLLSLSLCRVSLPLLTHSHFLKSTSPDGNGLILCERSWYFFTYSAPCTSLSPRISFLKANIPFQYTHTHTQFNGPRGSHVPAGESQSSRCGIVALWKMHDRIWYKAKVISTLLWINHLGLRALNKSASGFKMSFHQCLVFL